MHPLPVVILRRLVLWTFVCVISAAPSFLWAQREFNRDAMAVGVALFILAYTALTSTERFERFHSRPFVRRTLYIGYGLRLGASLLFPVGMAADVWPGLLSVGIVEGLGLRGRGFEQTLAITVVQGTLLNAILFVVMSLVYGIQRLAMKPPAEVAPRGFDVVMAGGATLPPTPSPQ
ncbi:MAG TPA: hypothetical protein VFB66_25235 [Tepidisphaeraceae bacterium]|nr:hypothetical protein [Tepidisphaeraceae bacterium]